MVCCKVFINLVKRWPCAISWIWLCLRISVDTPWKDLPFPLNDNGKIQKADQKMGIFREENAIWDCCLPSLVMVTYSRLNSGLHVAVETLLFLESFAIWKDIQFAKQRLFVTVGSKAHFSTEANFFCAFTLTTSWFAAIFNCNVAKINKMLAYNRKRNSFNFQNGGG